VKGKRKMMVERVGMVLFGGSLALLVVNDNPLFRCGAKEKVTRF
jgi:hypothetical protein